MIKISDSAKERLTHLLEEKGEENNYVRVGVESGGCSGLSYKLDFDNTKKMMMNLLKTMEFVF